MSSDTTSPEVAWLVYDGDCPLCRNYVQYLRLQDSAGEVRLVNARQPHPILKELEAHELNLNDGMVLKIGDSFYHGDDCVHALALMSSETDLFNRINAWVFRSRTRSRVLYPFLRMGRNTLLRLLGRKKITL